MFQATWSGLCVSWRNAAVRSCQTRPCLKIESLFASTQYVRKGDSIGLQKTKNSATLTTMSVLHAGFTPENQAEPRDSSR